MTSPPKRTFPPLLRRSGDRLGRGGPVDPEASEYNKEEIEDDDWSRVWTDWVVGWPREEMEALGVCETLSAVRSVIVLVELESRVRLTTFLTRSDKLSLSRTMTGPCGLRGLCGLL